MLYEVITIFEKPEESIGDDLVALDSFIDECTVLVTHSPAYGILDKGILGRRAGSHSIRDVITSYSIHYTKLYEGKLY